ncbi:MAG: C40 family peptidase [Eggerthellaceae bacterium]|nr:C40 family peptidase [Eggerthellaceae bacterium]
MIRQRLHMPRRTFLGGAAIFSVSLALDGLTATTASATPATSAEAQAEIDLVATKLADMRTSLESASDAYYKALQESEEATGKMQEAEEKIVENTQKIEKLQGTLGKRANDMYKNGPLTFLDVLLGSANFDAFVRNWDALTALNESDEDAITESKRLREENKENKRVAKAQKDVADKKAEEAAAARKQAEEMVATYEATVASLSEEKQRLIEEEQRIAAEAAAEAARARAEEQTRAAVDASNSANNDASTSSSSSAANSPSRSSSSSSKSSSSGVYKNNGGQSYPSVVAAAQSQLGVPYVWGGRTWNQALDCSGLTMLCYQKAVGIYIGSWTGAQYSLAKSIVPVSQAQPGDVLYNSGHVGICTQAGGGQYIHAPEPGDVVKYSSWSQFYCALRY